VVELLMAFPVATFQRSSLLAGQTNGKLAPAILETTPGQKGGPTIVLVKPAARAWRALVAAALQSGHILKATSVADSYRIYEIQERIFRQRYTTSFLAGRPFKVWNGRRWYQRPGTAVAAVPGTSNHGWGSAVDTGEERDSDLGTESLDDPTLSWLIANEGRYGWSHEVQSEPWHIRYNAGDNIPAAVLAYEKATPEPEPVPQPAPDENEDDMPYRTIEIVDGTHAGKTYMVTPSGPVHVIDRAELALFRDGGIVDKNPPVKVHAKQLGKWFDTLNGTP
jgi:LAS superfamily LD-carboxypeptidase LdcB